MCIRDRVNTPGRNSERSQQSQSGIGSHLVGPQQHKLVEGGMDRKKFIPFNDVNEPRLEKEEGKSEMEDKEDEAKPINWDSSRRVKRTAVQNQQRAAVVASSILDQ